MKKTFALLLAICLLVGVVPFSASAADLKASNVAQAYRQVLNSSSFYTYGIKKPVYFSNISGDAIPEMIVVTSSSTKTEAQVWTYQGSAAKKLLSMNWLPVAASKYYLYRFSDGKLAEYYTNAGYSPPDYSYESRSGYFYSLGADGAYTQTSSFEYNYYRYANGSTSFAGGKLNGSSATEAAVKAEENKLFAGSLIFDSLDDVSGAKTVQDARTYLNSIVGSFFDVPAGQYYTDAVEWAVNNGITSGTGTAMFSPNQSCTRAQAVTFLWRAAGSPEPRGSNTKFNDVAAGQYYTKAVQWAVENGITGGTSTNTFSPNDKCTRAQIVTFQYRMHGSPSVNGISRFTDVPASLYYASAVAWAVENGITSGTSASTFSPHNDCSRGQIVTFLYRDLA